MRNPPTPFQFHQCRFHGIGRLGRLPARNHEFWEEKIRGNRRRDRMKAAQLEAQNYKVITLFQCELKGLWDTASKSRSIIELLRQRSRRVAG